ncbi:MAG: hypothetical protein K2X27_22765 [Candidatus Obscuribacterales bacterium]|nr:hypothetical protein [Candidatus Obscuribacterales bacterium]
MSIENREVERKATVLENDIRHGDTASVQARLAWEAQNKPEEFDAVVRRFQEKNAQDCQKNGLLPKVEIHEDGGFLGFGSHVDDVKVSSKSAWGMPRKVDVYDKVDAPQQAIPQDLEIQGINMQAPQQIDTNNPLRALSNAWNSFTGGANKDPENSVKTYNGEVLPQAGFGRY